MSIANVAKLFYKMDHESDIKEAVDSIVAKYNSAEFKFTSREKIIEKELIPLGKKIGLNFTCEEFMEYLGNPSLQRLYETARVVGGSPSDSNFTQKIAANVAKKSIINGAINAADNFYNDHYISEQQFGEE